MNTLLGEAIEAHGGLARWSQIYAVSAGVSVGGKLWEYIGLPGIFSRTRIMISTRSQYVAMDLLERKKSFLFDKGKLGVQEVGGRPMQCLGDVRSHFFQSKEAGGWDEPQAAYFNGYALWQYLNAPFLYTYPGFQVEEVEPRREQDKTWRGLRVTFPDSVTAHSREQYAYFGEDRLLRCLRYTVDVLGNARGLNYVLEYRKIDGIQFPIRRAVYAYDDELRRVDEPMLVSIDIRDPLLIREGSSSRL